MVGVVSGDIDDADAYGVLGWLSSMKMGAGQEMVRSWNWIGSKKTVGENVKLEWNETND